jgi:hypothetical protein
VKIGILVKNGDIMDVAGQALEALRRALVDVPGTRLDPVRREPEGEGLGLLFRLELPAGAQTLAVEVLGSGEPKGVREALDRIYRQQVRLPEARFVLVAPYVSERAADLCSEQGVSYADLSGNCRLLLDQVFVRREGAPNAYARKRDLRSLYSPKAARVLRVLLVQPRKPWRIQSLADEAGVSLGQVANVKSLLLDREWAVAGPDGLVLTEPSAALAEWVQNVRFARPVTRDFYSLASVGEVESSLADACRDEGAAYALTSFSAAARLAPQVRYQRATAYVSGDLERVAQRLGLKEVTTGANVRLLEPADDGVLYGADEVDGLRIVSAIQCYLDLRTEPGRGAEAAETLMNEVLSPRW